MKKFDWFDFEEATKILIDAFSKEKKPTIFHSIRVGSLLYIKWFSIEICIAWLFHDSIEDTEITYDFIKNSFSEKIADIVFANTMNEELSKQDAKKDVVKRCYSYWEDAISVKIADVYDNFLFNKRIAEKWDISLSEIDRCKIFANLIKTMNNKNYNNIMFDLVEEILDY